MLRKPIFIGMLSIALISILSTVAEAKPRKIHRQTTSTYIVCDHRGCSDNIQSNTVAVNTSTNSSSYIPHPQGCPRRAFCGCGAAIRVFGTPRRDLWLARNWLQFARSNPSPGKAAVIRKGRNRGHVFVLEQHISGDKWLVTDYNSGGNRSRQHVRSISGYSIVDPHSRNI